MTPNDQDQEVYLYFYNAKAKEFTELRGLLTFMASTARVTDDQGRKFACSRYPATMYNNTVWLKHRDKAHALAIFMKKEADDIEYYKDKLSYHAWLHTKFRKERNYILRKETEHDKKIHSESKSDSDVDGREATETKPPEHNLEQGESDTGHPGLLPAT